MGFRADLDITGVLETYRQFLGGTAGINKITEGGRGPDDLETQLKAEPIPEHLFRGPETSAEPRQVGTGPIACSTSTVLALDPEVCHDVLGYYRALGVDWRASRGALGYAYRLGCGQRSARLTYVLSQLLNPAIRRAYDRTPLGELFLDDKYVQEQLKAAASKEASHRSAKGVFTTAVQVIEEEYDFVPEEDSTEPAGGSMVTPTAPSPDAGWQWGYYSWRQGSAQIRQLDEWQARLISCLSHESVPRLTVGVVANHPEPYAVAAFEGRRIIFLRQGEEPTQDLAEQAARTYLDRQRHITLIIR